jgi:hypothetical protein
MGRSEERRAEASKGENESVFENVASNTRWSIARISLNGLP